MAINFKRFITKPKNTNGISIITDEKGVKYVILHNEIKGFYRGDTKQKGARCGLIYGEQDTWLEIEQKYLNIIFDDYCCQIGWNKEKEGK